MAGLAQPLSERPAFGETSLCVEPEGTALLSPVVTGAVELLRQRFGAEEIESVILTGSLARGEASLIQTAAGPRLLGDIEMLVIVRPTRQWGVVRRRMVEIAAEATRQVAQDGRLATIEFTPATITYLRRTIRPCIFAWDLKEHGRVVWGRPDVLSEMRPFTRGDLPREDAVELLMNRLIELALKDGAARGGAPGVDDEARRRFAYRLVKTILEVAGSALAFAGTHTSRYADRPAAFAALCATDRDLAIAIPDAALLQRELAAAADCKLRPTLEKLSRPDLDALAPRVVAWVHGIWLWETRRWLERPSDPLPSLIEAYLRRETAARRFRGWLKYTLHPLRPRGSFSISRAARLCWTASPQRLAYAAAMLAHAGQAAGRQDWSARAERLLPLPGASGAPDVVRRAGELWDWLVRNN